MNLLIEPVYIGLIQTLLSLLLLSGFVYSGNKINVFFFKSYNHILFDLLISIIFFSHLIKIFSYIGFFKEINFIISFTILIFGIFNLKYIFNVIKIETSNISINFFEIFVILLIFLMFIVSIAPPTMADALDYHYGFPLFLLNFNEIPNPYLWLGGNLSGNGEYLNAIAIFLGTDNFATILQVLVLILFILFLKDKIIDKNKLLFLIIFILASPTIIQLISGPKFLLFPQVLTATALLLILEKDKIKINDYIFICILLLGATQFKLSFLLSISVIGLFLFLKAIKDNQGKVIFYSIFLFIIFFSPTFLWNYIHLIEFESHNLFSTIPGEFIETLHSYNENYNYFYPLNLLIPNSIGSISSILGFQFFLIFFLYRNKKELNLVILIIITTILLYYFLGQNGARFYFEFILWLAVGIYFLKDETINYKFFSKVIFIQSLVVFFMTLYYSIASFPSAFSNEYRDKFMNKTTFEYRAAKWVNDVLPKDAKVITQLRTVSLLNNEFVHADFLSVNNISDNKLLKYLNLIKDKKINYIILRGIPEQLNPIRICIGEPYAISPKFLSSTRNPLNQNQKYEVTIYYFNYLDALNCDYYKHNPFEKNNKIKLN